MKRSILLLISALALTWSLNAAETYTVSWSVNGSIVHSTEQLEGTMIVETPETPAACDGYGYTFVGWSDQPIAGAQTGAPNLYMDASEMPLVYSDVTYYAVFHSDATAGGGTHEVVDVLTRELTHIESGTATYADWTYHSETSDAMYAGNSSGGNDALQLQSSNNSSGIVTTASSGIAARITIEWEGGTANGRTINVYGKHTPYSSPTDLYGGDIGTTIGTLVYDGSSSSELDLPTGSEYEYIGIRSASGAVYMTSVSIVWRTSVAGDMSEYVTSCGGGGTGGDVYPVTLVRNGVSETINISGTYVLPGVGEEADACSGWMFQGWIKSGTAFTEGQTYTPEFVTSVNSATTLYAIYGPDNAGAGGGETWELVTDESMLNVGDVFVMACNSNGVTAGGISSGIMASVTSEFSQDGGYSTILSLGDGTVEMTLGGTMGEWTFTSESGLLGAQAAKKLVWGSGTTTWTISFESGNASITSTNSSYGTMLYNTTSPRFTTYSSSPSTTMVLPQLYRKAFYAGTPVETIYKQQPCATYTITLNNDGNAAGGTFEASSTDATAGMTVNLVANPDEGYMLSQWIVTDAGGAVIPVTDNWFVMPEGNVTVEAVFSEQTQIGDEPYTITLVRSGQSETISVTGTYTLPGAGEEANACEGWTFMGWIQSGTAFAEGQTYAPEFVTTVSSETILEAVYAEGNTGMDNSATYTFTSSSWGTSEGGEWVSDQYGAGFSNNGVQITTTTANANALCPTTYNEIDSVVVLYCTNASSGEGTVKISIGDTEQTQDVTKTGGTTPRNLSFDFSDSRPSGNPKIVVNCTTKSIYICGITIYYNGGGVTIYKKSPCSTYSVSFYSNNTLVETQSVSYGSLSSMPTDPQACEGYIFVGWSNQQIAVSQSWKPGVLYKTAYEFPAVTGDQTFYAVYALYAEDAADGETITITPSSDGLPSAYGTANTFTEYTLEGYRFQVQQMYVTGGKMQWRAGGNTNGTGTMYNSDAFPGFISSIELTYNSSDTQKNFTVKVGNDPNPTEGTSIEPTASGNVYTFDCSVANASYFVLANGSTAGYLDQIVIRIKSATGTTGENQYITSCGNTTGDPNATSGSLTGGQTWEILNDTTLYIVGGGSITGFSSPEEAPWYNFSSSITYLYLNADFFSIGDYVFYSLNNLATIQSPTSYKPTLSDNTFNTGSLGKHITLNIRESLKSQFEADPVWGLMNVYAFISDGDPTADDTYTVSWSVNGEIVSTMAVEAGNWISELPETPTSCDGKHVFAGWTELPIEGSQNWEPAVLFNNALSLPSVIGDITYYAVFSEGSNEKVDVLNRETTGATTASQYVNWTYTSETSGIKYVGNSAGGNDAIQLRSNNNSSGIVTTMSSGMATKITVEWGENNTTGNSLGIYGSSAPFASVEDMSGSTASLLGHIYYEDATTSVFELSRSYPYIGIRSANETLYLNSISITWKIDDGSTEYVTTCSSNQVTGSMDTGLTWSFDAIVRQLTIHGSGQMPDFTNDYDVPWYEYIDQIESVMVTEGVTYIGNNAFYACTNLNTITFPRSTDSIGVNIFSNPNRSFTMNLGAFIPPGITTETFGEVAGQLYIYVWESLWGLYLNTPVWENLMINSNNNPSDIDAMDVIDNQFVWYISDGTLHLLGRGDMPNYTEAPDQPWYDYRSNIYKIYMNSSSITQIGSYAFEGCNLMNEVILPPTLTYVGNRAFGDCTGLVELNACNVQDEYGFACDADAFIGVDMSAVTMRVPGTTQQESYQGTEIFSSCMFELCETGGGEPEDKLIESGECGPSAYWELYQSGLLIIKGSSYLYGYTYYQDIPWYNYRSQINTVEVQEGVESLMKCAFFDCMQMSSISLPSTLCCIDDSTFYNCIALRFITCNRDNPPSVNGTYPFEGVSLTSVYLKVPEGASTMYYAADYWKVMMIEEMSGGSVLEPYQLQAIFINDIGLNGFSPSLYNYDITLPANSEAPRISYMSGNVNQTVEIEQPASANSTGYIHVSVDGERKATYSLNFSCEITQVVIPLSHAWQFIMLPSMFGLGENDITNDAEIEWARYDGEKRAAGQSGWTIVDFSMSYYKDWGHIVRASGDSATITIQLPQNLNSRSATIHLYKYASSHEENKNWCLIGNPYNAEYRLEGFKAAGINSPIAVWNGIGYNTYDPEFDEYVIQPFEAFFVQLPDDAPEQITLQPEYVVGYENGSNTGNDSDEGALNGFFSVGEGVQVRFSKGNLQYYPLKDVWQFAENQYDTIGIANANISADYDGWIDLFGWGTGANPTLATQNAEDYAVFTDWGNNPINNGGYMEGLWRTLTSDEWNYLLTSRTKANKLRGVASVNGVNGMILLPDGWYDGSQPIAITTGTGDFSQNTLTSGDWEQLESAGAVFLPAVGYRSVTGVNSAGTYGLYWSATPNGTDNAYRLNFGSDYYDAQDYNSRNYGYSVRLVR